MASCQRDIVLIIGGDGTLSYVVAEMEEKGIDMSSISFAVFPFGTGNDLANVLGWGRRTN